MKNLRGISFLTVIFFLLPGQSQEVAISSPFPEAGKIRIVRDTYGLPHIFAANEPDAMYGLGYATAEDRLNQIFTTMYTAEGRLAELMGGADNLEGDILFRSFHFKQRADKPFSGPTAWYEAQISTPEFSVVGAVIPGLPIITMGHNGKIAWHTTNNDPDLADIYKFKINPDNAKEYLSHDGWRTFSEWEETFSIKKKDGFREEKKTIKETHVAPA
jgi:acyl-homoserine lactone acylase PvdQ